LSQADALAADGQRLMNEAQILRDEAYNLAPELKPKVRKKRAPNKKKAEAADTTAVKRKPGRPRKDATASAKS